MTDEERYGRDDAADPPPDWLVRARRARGLCGLCANRVTEPWLNAENITCQVCGSENRVIPHAV